MREEEKKVHYLAQELIPIVEDLEPEAKKIVMEHIERCESCQKYYSNSYSLDNELPTKNHEQIEVKPLKKLVQFNKGIKLLLIMVRVIILLYVILSGVLYGKWDSMSDAYPYIQTIIYIVYLPAAVFLLVFTFVFLNKKWLYSSLLTDIVIVFSLDFFLKLILFD